MANRLVDEASPYLQQHANNPVDWYPWGQEAFDLARKRDVPLFVSIGYATCHWCHVMERESFEDVAVATLMNDAFVNVKVDREERPDVDGIYMTVCQALTGHGGWPLNVVLTPDRMPIFAGTYIPPTSRHGRLGMLELIPRLKSLWLSERDRLENSAKEITGMLRAEATGDLSGELISLGAINDAALLLERQYDVQYHGFGSAPKFPTPHTVRLLLTHSHLAPSDRSRAMALETLGAMARGGLCDQIGFGFHRYSTDREWLVPHFEKMLYDQALLMDAFLDAYLVSSDPVYAGVVSDIAAYLERDLRSPEGAYFSAEDADSEGEEGKFYVWSADELRHVLGADFEDTAARYNVSVEGNYSDEVTGKKTGNNILHLAPTAELTRDEVIDRVREKLLEVRSQRVRPLLDDKMLADWNGLAIGALARSGAVLNRNDLVRRATEAAVHVLDRMLAEDGTLLHRMRGADVGIRGHLDDYAFMSHAALELFLATGKPQWLRRATELAETMTSRFGESANGGFFFAEDGDESLIVRRKDVQDGALPTGLSVAVSTLARLGRLLRRHDLIERARAAASSIAQSVARYPTAHTALLTATVFLEEDAGEVIIAGDASDPLFDKMAVTARRTFKPGRIVIPLEISQDWPVDLAQDLQLHKPIDRRPTAYVCQNFVCTAPTTELAELESQLAGG